MLIQPRWFPAFALLTFTCADAAGPPDDIEGACEWRRECAAHGSDVVVYDLGCAEHVSAEYDEASSYGCGAAYADWISCQATQRGKCPRPIVSSENVGADAGADSANAHADEYTEPCQGASDAFRLCQGKAKRDECLVIGSGGAGGCSIECALFSGECSAPARAGESSSCSCGTGDKVGASFMGQCGQDSLETDARSACQ
jgi:hypothetical protein